MYVHGRMPRFPQRSKEGARSPKTLVTHSHELAYGCWEANPLPLQKQALWTAEPSSPACIRHFWTSGRTRDHCTYRKALHSQHGWPAPTPPVPHSQHDWASLQLYITCWVIFFLRQSLNIHSENIYWEQQQATETQDILSSLSHTTAVSASEVRLAEPWPLSSTQDEGSKRKNEPGGIQERSHSNITLFTE